MARLDGRRIGLLTASASRLGGGVFEAVVRHTELVRSIGGTPVVLALEDRHSADDCDRYGSCEVIHCAIAGPSQIGFSVGLVPALMAARLDCLHLHGIWMYPSRAGSLWASATGKPYFISPHGMLDPWILSRGRWKKALARAGYERASWARAHAFHALTSREAADIVAATGRGDSVVIPNAAPQSSDLTPARHREPMFAYLGRIHPKKNLPALIAGWEQLDQQGRLPQGASLTIAGWGDPHDVAALKGRLSASPPSIQFIGSVFGEDKRRLLETARALVLPSLGEGLPMVVLEAWAAGTPLLMSEHCHLPEGFSAGAALDCGTEAGEVAEALAKVIAMPQTQWRAMSIAAIALAQGPFSGRTIAERWGEVYGSAMVDPAGHTP